MSIEVTGDRADEKEWLQPRISWGPIPTPRAHHFAFALGSKMFIIGGYSAARVPGEDALIFSLDTANMQWHHHICTGTLPNLDHVNRYSCVVDKDKKVLHHLEATLSGAGHVQSIQLYSLNLDDFTWTRLATTGAPLPLTLNESAISLCNNRIYVYGGMELSGTYHSSLKYLDLSNNCWVAGATFDCPVARANAGFANIGNNMFIWGGRSYSTHQPYPLPSLFVYDAVLNKWRDTRPKGSPPLQREGAALVPVGEFLVVFGGHNSKSITGDNLYMNDIALINTGGPRVTDASFNPQWLSFQTLNSTASPKKRQGASGVYIDGLIYFFGGEIRTNEWVNDLSVLRVVKSASSVGSSSSVDAIVAAKIPPLVPGSSSSIRDVALSTTVVDDDDLSAEGRAIIAEVDALHDIKSRLSWALNNPKTYPDVEFKLKNGKTILAHKVILAARSIVFRRKYDPVAASKMKRDEDGEVTQSHLDISAESAIGSPKGHSSPSLRGASRSHMRGSPSTTSKSHARSSSSSSEEDHTTKTSKKVSDVDLDSEKKTGSSLNLATSTTPSVDVINVPDDFEESDLLAVLKYIYTGAITIDNADQAERYSAIGYEYLLDELMRQCRSKTFPISITEAETSLSRFLRRMVGSTVGSDIFFVVKRKKLLAHRVILFLFSTNFRRQLLHIPTRRYIEIRDSPGVTVTVDTFVEFCRTMYCFFTAMPEHKEKQVDVASLLGLALSLRETKLVDLLAKQQVVTNETVLTTYEVAKAHNLGSLQKSCLVYILENFSSVVKDKAVMDSWPADFKQEVLDLYKQTCPSWLDLLWYAHQTGDNGLKDEALRHLTDLINVENVINILVGAHTCGAKQLRSKCVDFILQQAGDVQAVQRMQNFGDTNLSRVSALSTSLNNEMHQKVHNQVTAAGAGLAKSKLCTICFKEFSFFTNKKNSCTLCKRAACKDCIIQNFTIPPVFGYTKPKSVCKNCHQMVGLFQ